MDMIFPLKCSEFHRRRSVKHLVGAFGCILSERNKRLLFIADRPEYFPGGPNFLRSAQTSSQESACTGWVTAFISGTSCQALAGWTSALRLTDVVVSTPPDR